MSRHLSRLAVAVFVVAVVPIGSGHAQKSTPRGATMPGSWRQLRAGVDNAGRTPGSLTVAWRFKSPRPVRGLSVVDGVVLLGTESPDAAARVHGTDQRGFLIALDAFTGARLWQREVSNWIHGDPVIFQGRAFATYGSYPMNAPGGVTAVDLKTGNPVWSLPVNMGIMPAPALDSATQTLVVAGGDGVIRMLDPVTGSVKSTAPLGSPNAMASPRIDDDGIVYLGADTSLFSFSTRTGRFNWTYRSPNLVEIGTPPPALTDTVVFTQGTQSLSVWQAFRELPFDRFVQFGREAYDLSDNRLSTHAKWFEEQWLLAIDRRDGHLLWQQPLGVGRIILRNNSGIPVVSDDQVFISSPVSRTISAFNAATGQPLWKQPLDAIHVGAVTVIDDDLVLGDRSGDIILLRDSDGARVGRCHVGAPFSPTAPLVVGKTMFAATRDGWVYATPYDSLRSRATRSAPASCF